MPGERRLAWVTQVPFVIEVSHVLGGIERRNGNAVLGHPMWNLFQDRVAGHPAGLAVIWRHHLALLLLGHTAVPSMQSRSSLSSRIWSLTPTSASETAVTSPPIR